MSLRQANGGPLQESRHPVRRLCSASPLRPGGLPCRQTGRTQGRLQQQRRQPCLSWCQAREGVSGGGCCSGRQQHHDLCPKYRHSLHSRAGSRRVSPPISSISRLCTAAMRKSFYSTWRTWCMRDRREAQPPIAPTWKRCTETTRPLGRRSIRFEITRQPGRPSAPSV